MSLTKLSLTGEIPNLFYSVSSLHLPGPSSSLFQPLSFKFQLDILKDPIEKFVYLWVGHTKIGISFIQKVYNN